MHEQKSHETIKYIFYWHFVYNDTERFIKIIIYDSNCYDYIVKYKGQYYEQYQYSTYTRRKLQQTPTEQYIDSRYNRNDKNNIE